ncbi:hypothetical protein EJB05_04205, partial [Eragrostis curvula]
MSGDADPLRACRAAARRRLRERVGAIVRLIRAPLADVLRDHALVHLPPAAAARLQLVHPSWARALGSPLFAVTHAAAPRRASGLFAPSAGFLPLDAADTVPSPSLGFVPASSELAVLSSTRGLACCFSLADDAYFVCNPATASWAGVPSPPRRTWPRPAVVVLFDATAYNFRGDYALVSAFESVPGSGTYCFAVFTSGAGAWWVADAIAPAEGLVPASGVAAGGTAWWRTTIGTAVGYNLTTGRVELALCPGDSAHWEIGSVADRLHCAVLDEDDVVVCRLAHDGGWEVAARVAVAEILQSWTPPEETVNEQEEEAPLPIVAAANRVRLPSYDVRLLPFQGAEVEVVVLAGRRVVAFDMVTRRRREAALPNPPEGREWSAAEYTAHTNTLALVAPAVLAREPALTEPPDDPEPEDASS